MEWKVSDGHGKKPNAGIDCSHLHGISFVDGFAWIAATKEKTLGTAIDAVDGLISGMKQFG